jgi:hypothetical protein
MTKPARDLLTDADRTAIIEAIAAGATIRKVAHRLRVEAHVVAVIILRHGEPAKLARSSKNCRYYIDKYQERALALQEVRREFYESRDSQSTSTKRNSQHETNHT